jgi:hypothetical protein
MTFLRPRSRSQRGNTLVITVIATGVIGFVLVAYLSLVRSQNINAARSQVWNSCMPIVEAGLEEALTHLNAHGESNLVCDGWAQYNQVYWLKRTVGDGYYVTTISNWVAGMSNQGPVIECRGYSPLPAMTAALPGPMLASVANTSGRSYLVRAVRLTTRLDALFVKGLVAKDKIDLMGFNIDTDSFDSSNPLYNTGGLYDAAKNRDNGDIATNSSLTNSLNVGNAKVRGRVATGPNGSVAIGPVGSVGSKAWVNGGTKGIQPGYRKDDMNVDFKDVKPPFGGGAFTPSGGTVDGVTYKYVLNSGNYQLADLKLSGSDGLLVTSNAVLYVTDDLSIIGNGYIQVAPGASLKLYVAAGTASLGGNGMVNQTGNATNVFLYGLPSNTRLDYTGNSAFVGVIYAPNADLQLGGGGSTPYDFVGAGIARTIKMNGHFNFHYDEALGKYGPMRGFIVTSWNEMTPTEVSSGPPLNYSPGGAL